MKRWGILALVVIALVVIVGGIKAWSVYSMIQGFKAKGVPTQTVSAIEVKLEQWRPTVSAIGNLHAVRGADLSAEVAGIVEQIRFQSGDEAKAGEVLATLRDADEVARLQALRADAALAESDHQRAKAQFEIQAISKAALDASAAQLTSAKAQVAEQQALVDKKTIRAPFAGHLGIRSVDPGQYLAPGTKLVTLQQLDPIHVDFTLPQQALAQVRAGQIVHVRSDTYPGTDFTGTILAVNPKVDTNTRTVQLRATLQNPEHRLLPGMYADVTIDVGETQPYMTLPQAAIAFNPYGETVYVVTTAAKLKAEQDAKRKQSGETAEEAASVDVVAAGLADDALVAKQVFVTVGPTRGDQIAILKGLEPGQQVVTTGQLKLKTGTAVRIDNSAAPRNDPDPRPTEQ